MKMTTKDKIFITLLGTLIFTMICTAILSLIAM